VPEIWNSDSTAAPAPKMLPVWGKPAIGTALALNLTVGAAEARLGTARARRPAASAARLRVALRIPVLLQSWFAGRRVALRCLSQHVTPRGADWTCQRENIVHPCDQRRGQGALYSTVTVCWLSPPSPA